jgi:O-antigen/teichoic acid export membrane protein
MADVGVATAMVSAVALVVSFSRLGIDQSLIRFAPTGNRHAIIGTTFIITTLVALALGGVVILIAGTLLPAMAAVKANFILYLTFVAVSSLVSVALNSFVALRKSEYGFAQSLIGASRLGFLVPLVAFGAVGIFGAELLSAIAIAAFSIWMLRKMGLRLSRLDTGFLKSSLGYSFGNYVAGTFSMLPAQIMPLVVIAALGAEDTAAFYVTYMIFNVLLLIPVSSSTALFVEGSHGVDLRIALVKSMRLAMLSLIPMVAMIVFAGHWLLSLIGEGYADTGYNLLVVMSLSSLPTSVFLIYVSALKVQKRIRDLVAFCCLGFVVIMTASIALAPTLGLVGIGWAWFSGYGICSLVSIPGFIAVLRSRRQAIDGSDANRTS